MSQNVFHLHKKYGSERLGSSSGNAPSCMQSMLE